MYIYAISNDTLLYIPIARFLQKELHTLGRPNLLILIFASLYVNYTLWRLIMFLTFVCFFCKCETFLFWWGCGQLVGIGQSIVYFDTIFSWELVGAVLISEVLFYLFGQ